MGILLLVQFVIFRTSVEYHPIAAIESIIHVDNNPNVPNGLTRHLLCKLYRNNYVYSVPYLLSKSDRLLLAEKSGSKNK